MNKIKNILVTTLLVFLLAQFASAGLESSVEEVTTSIFPTEEAEFILYVTNDGDQAETIQYTFANDPEWSMLTEPAFTKRTIEAGDTLETVVTLRPFNPDRINYKQYELDFLVQTESTFPQRTRGQFKVFIKNPNAVYQYIPLVNVDVDVPTQLDPRKDATLDIKLKNLNRLQINDYTFEITSKLNPENNQIRTVQVNSLEESSISDIVLQYDNTQSPTTEVITITPSIPSENRTYPTITKTIEIIEYKDPRVTPIKDKKFLKTTETIRIVNNGNVEVSVPYSISSSIFKKFFTKSTPDYDVKKENGYRYLTWSIDVPKQETREIVIIVNYRPLIAGIIILAIIVAAYYFGRSPIVSRKEAKNISGQKDETTRMKVLVHVKNRTNKAIESIEIVEKIPQIAELEEEFAIGTLQPSKIIKHEKKGTVVKWKIPTLEAFEERIISYQVYSKLEIIGPLKLKPALVKFKNNKNKLTRTYSNSIDAE